jgi:predicted protein tyrosine phosphatase
MMQTPQRTDMTTYRSVEFVSRSTAISRKGDSDTIVISINNSFDQVAQLQSGWKDVLVLQFDDVESFHPRYKAFHFEHANPMVEFLRKYEATASKVLVHWLAGECRSAAVAKIVAQMYNLSFPKGYDLFHRRVYEVLLCVTHLDWEE